MARKRRRNGNRRIEFGWTEAARIRDAAAKHLIDLGKVRAGFDGDVPPYAAHDLGLMEAMNYVALGQDRAAKQAVAEVASNVAAISPRYHPGWRGLAPQQSISLRDPLKATKERLKDAHRTRAAYNRVLNLYREAIHAAEANVRSQKQQQMGAA